MLDETQGTGLSPAEVTKTATGQDDLEDALAWIAEGHSLRPGASIHDVLKAVVALGDRSENQPAALRRLARHATESTLDTGAVIFNPELLTPLTRYKRVLDLLAEKSPDRTLASLMAEAVAAAQREDPLTMEVFCAIAGLTFRDIKERLGDEVPNALDGRWPAKSVAAVFGVVDAIVRGVANTTVARGAISLKPIELILEKTTGGWTEIERLRCSGVPYEWLLAQRTVGSAWGAHRNRTSSKLIHVVASALCAELDRLGVTYRRSKSVGGTIRPSEVQRLAGGSAHVSLVALDRRNRPFCGVAFSIARDGGTARKNAGRLQAMARHARLPLALVVAGPGWSMRNETGELAAALLGCIYSDCTISILAKSIHDGAMRSFAKDT